MNVRQVASITDTAARRMIEAAVAAATAAGQPAAVAVVDAGGNLTAFTRMDGAALQAAQIAQDKAYTAVGFAMPSGRWHEFLQQDAPLQQGAPTAIDRFVPFGGGLPIVVDDEVVGAIGVSGGHWSVDEKVAQAGLDALG